MCQYSFYSFVLSSYKCCYEGKQRGNKEIAFVHMIILRQVMVSKSSIEVASVFVSRKAERGH